MPRRPRAAPVDVPVEPPALPANLTITNCLPGTTLCLADGSSIQFGESADVSAEEAEFLRERGQVE